MTGPTMNTVRFCYVDGCGVICDGDKYFCLRHWHMIPPAQQAALFRAQEEERAAPPQTFDQYPDEDWMGVEERVESGSIMGSPGW